MKIIFQIEYTYISSIIFYYLNLYIVKKWVPRKDVIIFRSMASKSLKASNQHYSSIAVIFPLRLALGGTKKSLRIFLSLSFFMNLHLKVF